MIVFFIFLAGCSGTQGEQDISDNNDIIEQAGRAMDLGDLNRAEKILRKCRDPRARLIKARIYAARKEYRKAEEEFKKAASHGDFP